MVKPETKAKLSKIVGGLIDGKTFEEWPAWKGRGVPTRENCDLANPRQKFLWMFVAMPGMRGAPLMLPPEFWELQSWRMSVLGADIAREPTQKWQAPANMLSNSSMAAGKWVGLDTPEPQRQSVAEAMAALPQGDRAEIRRVVLEHMGLNDTKGEAATGRYRVSDLAERLGQPIDTVIAMLGRWGLNVHPGTLVGREVAERVVAHLGLDA